jgi:hypothetical protein
MSYRGSITALVPRFTLKAMTHHHHTIAVSKDPFLHADSTNAPVHRRLHGGGDAKQQRLTTVPASCKNSFD